MAMLRLNITMSLDGYVAGPNQSVENPLGEGGEALHEWAFATRSFRAIHGRRGRGRARRRHRRARGTTNIGATIMGRNMFGPVRGAWGDDPWPGWWGDDPPYHTPVFVLTHHAREPLEMQGGTTFHFVTDGIEVALERAVDAAGGRDVALGGGAGAVQQYLRGRARRRDGDPRRSSPPRRRVRACSTTWTAGPPGTNASDSSARRRWRITAMCDGTARSAVTRRPQSPRGFLILS